MNPLQIVDTTLLANKLNTADFRPVRNNITDLICYAIANLQNKIEKQQKL